MEEHTPSTAERFDRLADPIFIGGYMRSGTSFIMKLLQGHPHTTGIKADADLLGPILGAWMPESGHGHPYTGIMAVLKRDADRIRQLVRANWFFIYEFAGLPIFAKRIVEKTPDSQALFARTCEVFPRASFVIVIREPISSVRSALAHSLLFYPHESGNVGATLDRVIQEWTQSMHQTRDAVRELGERILLVNFDEFLGDPEGQTRHLFAWCGIEPSDDAVARAIKFAGNPGDERAFWQTILAWPEDEFAKRYELQLDDIQQRYVGNQTLELFADIDALRKANRPGLSASASTETTASPGS